MKHLRLMFLALAAVSVIALVACGSTGGSAGTEAATFSSEKETEISETKKDEIAYFDKNAVPGETLHDVGEFTVYVPDGWFADASYAVTDEHGTTRSTDEPATDSTYVAKAIPDIKETQGAHRNGSAYVYISREEGIYVASKGLGYNMLGSSYENEPVNMEIGGVAWEGFQVHKDGELYCTGLSGRIDDGNWFYVEVSTGSAEGADISMEDEDVISIISSISEQILAEQALG